MFPSFALTRDAQVLVGVPHCSSFFRTRLRPAPHAVGTAVADWHAIEIQHLGRETSVNAVGRAIGPEDLVAPDGSPLRVLDRIADLSPDGREALASALFGLSMPASPAFQGSPDDGRAIARCLAELLGLPFRSYVVTERSRFRDVYGHADNPRTVPYTEFGECVRDGGCFLVDVPELSSAVGPTLGSFGPFLAGHLEPVHHDEFVLLFNLPESDLPVPGEIGRDAHWIWVERGSAGLHAEAACIGSLDPRPGSVLVLMKFKVPVYEAWFREVVEPVVSARGRCLRIDQPLADWRTEMRRHFERADATVVDLSYDALGEISPHVLWELTEILKSPRLKGQGRSKVLCGGRGLDHVRSREADPAFVWLKDVAPDWVPLGKRNLDFEKLLGLRIRRYRPGDPADRTAYQGWLRSGLEPWIQGVPAPVSDGEIRRMALALGEAHSSNWHRIEPFLGQVDALPALRKSRIDQEDLPGVVAVLVANRDIEGCHRLIGPAPVPEAFEESLGWLLSSVTAVETHLHEGYWPLAKKVVTGSRKLREHMLDVLRTAHIHMDTVWTNQYRLRAWRSLGAVRFGASERARLEGLIEMERDPDVRLDALEVVLPLLSADEQRRARAGVIERAYGIDTGRVPPGSDDSSS